MNIRSSFFSILCILFYTLSYAQVPFASEREVTLDDEMVIPEEEFKGDRLGYYRQNGKTGLVVNSVKITKPIYDKVNVKSNVGFIVKKDNHYGFIDIKGKEKISFKYDSIRSLGYKLPYLLVKKKGKYGVLATDGSKVLPFKYKKIIGVNSSNQFAVYDKDEKLLLVTLKGRVIASDVEKMHLYSNGAILSSKGKFGLFTKNASSGFVYDTIGIATSKKNIKNKRFKTKPYTLVTYKKLHRLIVMKDQKVGMIDTLHSTIIPIENDNIINSGRRYYTIEKDKKKGVYLTKCNTYIAPKYDGVYMDGTTYLQVQIERKKGLIDDANGVQILPVEYDKIYKTGKTFVVTKDKKKGVSNSKGEIIIPLQYDEIDHLGGLFSSSFNGLYKVESNKKYGVVNSQNEMIIPITSDWLGDFEKGLILFRKNNKFGVYDLKGKMIQKPIFDFVERERTSAAKIMFTKKEGLYGALDRKGEVVLENVYSDLYTLPDAQNNLTLLSRQAKNYYQAIRHTNGKEGVFNVHTGKIEIPLEYDKIYQTIKDYGQGTTYFLVKKGTKYGIITSQNKAVVDFKYDLLNVDLTWVSGKTENESFKKIAIVAKKDGKYGVINFLKETLIPFEYKEITKISSNGLFKAKKEDHYVLINAQNQVLNAGPFDEIANFEYSLEKALSFHKGKMREIDETGKFLTPAVAMKPHKGFTSFKELKSELIKALNDKNDVLLREFAEKIGPSKHLMYFFQYADERIRSKTQNVNYEYVVNKYYKKLLEFKRYTWNSEYFNKNNLSTEDYTVEERGITTNKRRKDWAYDDTRILEKFLRNSLKVNGYWISSYFTRRNL